MKKWFMGLSTVMKVVVLAVAIIVLVLIYDYFTGGIRDIKNWAFDRKMAQIEAQNDQLLKENEALRKSAEENARKAEETRIREQAVIAQAEQKGIEIQKIQQDTEKALAEVRKEEEITAQPTDAKTRCIRTKEKMLAQGIKSAREINCDEVQ